MEPGREAKAESRGSRTEDLDQESLRESLLPLVPKAQADRGCCHLPFQPAPHFSRALACQPQAASLVPVPLARKLLPPPHAGQDRSLGCVETMVMAVVVLLLCHCTAGRYREPHGHSCPEAGISAETDLARQSGQNFQWPKRTSGV